MGTSVPAVSRLENALVTGKHSPSITTLRRHAEALGTAARARGLTQITREAGVNRESLYKSLSSTTAPRFDTISRVMGALGLKLVAVPKGT